MALPIWPLALPQMPLSDGNSETMVSNATVFQPDKGPPMKRQGATAQNALISFTCNLTAAQTALFYEFYDIDMQKGSGRFQWIDPYRDVPHEFQIEGEVFALDEMSPGLNRLSMTLRRVS